MKKCIALLTGILLFTGTHAQHEKDVPAFGKVEKADLQMKECDFDKNAEAVVLFDVAELAGLLATSFDIQMERHIRIKILKDKGLPNADIHIPYVSFHNGQSIKGLVAQTYNLDASGNITVTKVEKKLFYDKRIDSRYSEQVFTFPEVKAGSIIEYKYTLLGADLEDWSFQTHLPVKYSRYRIDFPSELEIYCSPHCILPFTRKDETVGTRYQRIFSMQNIPALRDEPYISCEGDYVQRLELRPLAINLPLERISLVHPWPKIIKSLMDDEDFGLQLKRNIPRTRDLDSLLKPVTDPYRKMVIIHDYVRRNMEWNGYSNIWAMDGVRAAWKDKKGTAGEINLILVNLLKDAGLSAHPILVSTRSNGRVMTAVSDARQFNKVLAEVDINKKKYILDATEKYTPPHLIPMDVMMSEGLVIEKIDTYEWGWQMLWDENQLLKNLVVIQGTINEQGQMSGEAYVASYDYARVAKMPDVKKGKEKFQEKYFAPSNSGITVDSLVFENEDQDTLPLIQRFHFTAPVNASGDYKYFSANMFTGLEKNPFVADTRFSDVFFGVNQSYNIVVNIAIPADYQLEALPKNKRLIMPDTSITLTRRVAATEQGLGVNIAIEFKKPFFLVDEYEYFKEFYKLLFEIVNEQFAIRRKPK